MRRLITKLGLVALLVAAFIVVPVRGQTDEDCALESLSLLQFTVIVENRPIGKTSGRVGHAKVTRPLTEKDFEVLRYEQRYEIDYFTEVKSNRENERVFVIGVMLEPGKFTDTFIVDRMTVGLKNTRNTWGLSATVLTTRIADGK